MNMLTALKIVHDDPDKICGPTGITFDCIEWNPGRGWVWHISQAPVHLLHPCMTFGNWIVGDKPDLEVRG